MSRGNSYLSKYSPLFTDDECCGSYGAACARKVALCTSAAFAGVALYVNLVEQPARLQLDNASALKQWKASYARAAPMQAGLALVSSAIGAVTAYQTGDKVWLVGSGLMLANLPYTLLCILPLNNRLLDTKEAMANSDTRADLQRWSQLHAVRTVLGLLGTGAFLYAVCKK